MTVGASPAGWPSGLRLDSWGVSPPTPQTEKMLRPPAPPQMQESTLKSRACKFGCLEGASRSVQGLLSGIEAVLVLTLIILK